MTPHGPERLRSTLPARCSIHDDQILIDEPGGPLMPTLYGRLYCPICSHDLLKALDEAATLDTFEPHDLP